MNDETKIFFQPGDIVTLKQDIPNKPVMIVVKKETSTIKLNKEAAKEEYFIGIKCRWFSTEGLLQEGIFNTKDLLRISKELK